MRDALLRDPPAPSDLDDEPEPETTEVPPHELERARAFAGLPPTPQSPERISPRRVPTGPVTPVGLRAMPGPPSAGVPTESELRNRILAGISGQYAAAPAPPPLHAPAPPPAPADALSDAWASAPSGSYVTATPSGPPSATGRREPAEDRVPIGYVIASAFFLAIAVVGFGVWLALEVISL